MAYLEFDRITKRFPGALALNGVSFGIEEGSCHALIGENGAGKSTLGKILAGVLVADEGEMRLGGRAICPHTPLEARQLGIAMVHQELAFCPNMSVAENLSLGDFPRNRFGWIDRGALQERAIALLESVGADIDPRTRIGELSTGREQLVQIAAAVGTGARIIVFDEPTSSLSEGETRDLFRLIAELRRRRITLVYISHRMEELFALCDRITVLRDGRHVSTEAVADTTPKTVVTRMIGRELLVQSPQHLNRPPGATRLDVSGLRSPGRFSDITFSVAAGEIVGMAGLVGAGRSEIAQAILGLDEEAEGSVKIDGRPLKLGSVEDSMKAGIGLVPEDRKRQGLVLALNCRENTSLASLESLAPHGWVQRRRERALASNYAGRLRLKAPSIESATATLSGGNQQKISLAKWLARGSEVLMVDEPTRGIDVGAKAEIYELLDELACSGKAILMISSDLPELIGLCRRILVMRGGRLVADVPRSEGTEARLMHLMAGVS